MSPTAPRPKQSAVNETMEKLSIDLEAAVHNGFSAHDFLLMAAHVSAAYSAGVDSHEKFHNIELIAQMTKTMASIKI